MCLPCFLFHSKEIGRALRPVEVQMFWKHLESPLTTTLRLVRPQACDDNAMIAPVFVI